MNSAEILDKIKAQNRVRSQNYYNRNKIIILERRKSTRNTPKEEQPPQKKEINMTTYFYDNTLKTLFKILLTDNLKTMFKKYNDVIIKINTSSYNNKLYSTNSKKAMYQTILFLISNDKIKVSKKAHEAYKKEFELLNITSREQTEQNQQKETVLKFDEYLKKIKEAYGEGSKQYLISLLYSFYSFRDDLILEVIPTEKEATETNKNYVVIPTGKIRNCIIILNEYKTSKRYGQDIISLNSEISNLMKQYKSNNDIKNNGFLFGEKPLSGYIKKFNDKLNLNITINTLRQMKVSETLNEKGDAETRLNLSKIMKHSPETSKKYKRTMKTNDII